MTENIHTYLNEITTTLYIDTMSAYQFTILYTVIRMKYLPEFITDT